MTDRPDLQIHHSESAAGGAFFIQRDGARIAELTYRRDGVLATIDHTEVQDVLRGLGVARRLLDAAVGWARSSGVRLAATCPYASAQFGKDPSIRDVLADR